MSEDQLQPEDTLDDRGVEDALDEGYSPAEKLRGSRAKGTTPREAAEGETVDDRLSQEAPEEGAFDDLVEDDELDEPTDAELGEERAGRLVEPDQGAGDDLDAELVADDVGIDGAGASAEEAAVHRFEEHE